MKKALCASCVECSSDGFATTTKNRELTRHGTFCV